MKNFFGSHGISNMFTNRAKFWVSSVDPNMPGYISVNNNVKTKQIYQN